MRSSTTKKSSSSTAKNKTVAVHRRPRGRTDTAVFGVLVVVSLALIVLGDVRQVEIARGISMVVFYPFEKAVANWKGLTDLRRENTMLRHRVTELSVENQRLREFEHENRNLRKLVEFKQREDLELVPAEVIGRDPNRLTESFDIDRGKDAQIKTGMPVVTAEGILGKVSDVRDASSVVQTVYSRDFRVSCLEMKSRVMGILRWKGGPNCSLDNVPIQAQVSLGDTIVSSGFGGVFPKGLLVGTIVSIRPDNTGLFHEIEVAPAAGLSRVEEVFVVKSIRTRTSGGRGQDVFDGLRP
jgi:rod shape-determining protein MreC